MQPDNNRKAKYHCLYTTFCLLSRASRSSTNFCSLPLTFALSASHSLSTSAYFSAGSSAFVSQFTRSHCRPTSSISRSQNWNILSRCSRVSSLFVQILSRSPTIRLLLRFLSSRSPYWLMYRILSSFLHPRTHSENFDFVYICSFFSGAFSFRQTRSDSRRVMQRRLARSLSRRGQLSPMAYFHRQRRQVSRVLHARLYWQVMYCFYSRRSFRLGALRQASQAPPPMRRRGSIHRNLALIGFFGEGCLGVSFRLCAKSWSLSRSNSSKVLSLAILMKLIGAHYRAHIRIAIK